MLGAERECNQLGTGGAVYTQSRVLGLEGNGPEIERASEHPT